MRSILFGLAAGVLLTGASLAEGKQITVTVPVDIAAMPYVQSFSVQCALLAHPEDLTSGGAAFNRVDQPLVNGAFHGMVSMKLVAVWGPNNDPPPPWGYRCDLHLFAKGQNGGFTPIAPADANEQTPPYRIAAPNTPFVTVVKMGFGPVRPMQMAPTVRATPHH